MANLKLLQEASEFHHKPLSMCVVCTQRALTKTYYKLFDEQVIIDKNRPEESFLEFYDNHSAIKVLISSCDLSIHYLITHLQETELSEFEAYIGVSRNLIEKVSKIKDLDNKENLEKASKDFDKTYNEVMKLFESKNPSLHGKQLKNEKWLDRGVDKSNIKGEEMKLIHAYLSRVLHVQNMDTLLSPKEDRFFVKAYILIKVSEIYHETCRNQFCLSKFSQKKHTEVLNYIKKTWNILGVTSEQLIYCTSFYADKHTTIEESTIQSYIKILNNAFRMYSENGQNLVPLIEYEKGE